MQELQQCTAVADKHTGTAAVLLHWCTDVYTGKMQNGHCWKPQYQPDCRQHKHKTKRIPSILLYHIGCYTAFAVYRSILYIYVFIVHNVMAVIEAVYSSSMTAWCGGTPGDQTAASSTDSRQRRTRDHLIQRRSAATLALSTCFELSTYYTAAVVYFFAAV